MALKARIAATSAPSSRLLNSTLPKAAGRAHIHKKHHRKLPLLGKLLDVRRIHSRRDIPIDAANFVTGRVFANLLEVHAAAL